MQERHIDIASSDGQWKHDDCEDSMTTRAHETNGRRVAWTVVATVLVLAALTACGAVRLPGQTQTLQRAGGLRVMLSLSCPVSHPACDIQTLSTSTRDILQRRAVQGLGVVDAVTRLDGDTSIVIELPAYTNEAQARAILGSRGEVDILDTGATSVPVGTNVSAQLCAATCAPGQYKIVFTGDQFDPTAFAATLDQQSQQPVVTFAFARQYQQQFADYTRQHIGQYLTIALDGSVIECATIQSEIDGTGQITDLKSLDEARALVIKLKYQALPLAVTVSNVERVPPTPTTAQ